MFSPGYQSQTWQMAGNFNKEESEQRYGHMMPPPQNLPWNVEGCSWGMPSPQPSLVEFTGRRQAMKNPLHCKRKQTDVEPVIPAKQLITEEKITAHFNSLHISSDHTNQSRECSTPLLDYDDMDMNCNSISIEERLKSAQAITLSEEIRKIKEEPIIPKSIIESIEKPCMSLVVWQPRDHIIPPANSADNSDENHNPYSDNITFNTNRKRIGILVDNHVADSMDVEM